MAGDDIDDARSEFASLFSAQTGASGEGEGESELGSLTGQTYLCFNMVDLTETVDYAFLNALALFRSYSAPHSP